MISLVHPSRGHITQFYGARQIDGNPHAGQDYAYSNRHEIFPEVYAAADGVVIFAGDSRGLSWPNVMYLNIDFDRTDAQDSSAGNYTIIGHYRNGVMVAMTGYGHQEQVWVRAGQAVTAGQQIGVCGETGFSAGKHLHFDFVPAPFRVDVAPYYGRVDPNPYFVSGTTYNLNSSQLGTTTPPEDDEMKPEQMQELKVFIQNENVRYHEATRSAVINGIYEKSIKGVAGDGINLTQLLSEYRSHIMMITSLIDAVAVGAGISVEDVQKAVTDGLAAGVKIDATVRLGA